MLWIRKIPGGLFPAGSFSRRLRITPLPSLFPQKRNMNRRMGALGECGSLPPSTLLWKCLRLPRVAAIILFEQDNLLAYVQIQSDSTDRKCLHQN